MEESEELVTLGSIPLTNEKKNNEIHHLPPSPPPSQTSDFATLY